MRASGLACQTVAIKVRTVDFVTLTRSRTLPGPTDLTRQIVASARDLLARVDLRGLPVRLLGVRLEHLVPASRVTVQPTLDGDDGGAAGQRRIEAAGDALRRRFGSGALRPASLVTPPGQRAGSGGEG
jgi:DNA polymerase-4